MPDETVWRTMLFDFYGDLLTDKQREYYDLHYNQDLSLAEIAAFPLILLERKASAARTPRCAIRRPGSVWCSASLRSARPRQRWRIRSRSCAIPSAATPGCWPSRRCGSFRI